MAGKATKKPSHYAYSVKQGKDEDNSFWTKIGVAFAYKDGEGFDLVLEAVPLDGRVRLRVPKERESGKK